VVGAFDLKGRRQPLHGLLLPISGVLVGAPPAGWRKGGAIPEGFYVQVRYPHAGRWVTLALFDVRPTAAGVAADAYRDRHNGRGETPRQVRVVTAGQLRREGGQRDLTIAEADVARGATG
jgi:hypothetical protein